MSTKTKERTESRSGARFVPVRYVGDHIRIGHLQSGVTVKDTVERISYGVGAEFNPCTHSKRVELQQGWSQVGTMQTASWHCRGGSYSPQQVVPPTFEVVSGTEYNKCEVYYGSWPSGSIRGDVARLENSKLDAYSSLRALRPPAHANWLQAVYELKDSKQTLGQVIQFMNWVRKSLGRKVRIPRKGLGLVSVGSRIADLAAAYLWYKFGIEPTITDVRKFCEELGQGKLKCYSTTRNPKTVAKKGEVMVYRYSNAPARSSILDAMFGSGRATSGTGTLSLSRGQSTFVTWPFSGLTDERPSYGKKLVVEGITTGCYFARVKRDVTISGLDDLKRRWEWNCPAIRTMWELVPFSFLVDWIVGVGDTIGRLERRYCTQSFLTYLGPVWVTERTTTTTYMPVVSGSATVTQGLPPSSVYDGGTLNLRWEASYGYYAKTRVTAFTRRPLGSPPAVAVPQLAQRVHAYQITTGMALLLQAAKAWMTKSGGKPARLDWTGVGRNPLR